ncbi:MAG: SGNH/GDSL hydrolase family protein [Nitrospiraceae bacterium]
MLVAAYVLLITLVALEAAVRIWGYSEPHIYDPIYTSFDRTKDIPYIHKPNLMEARARGLAVINTDSLGLRAKIAGTSYGAKQPNEYRIAVVGDSCTFGEGVTRTEDTFAQVLEDTLNQRQQAVSVKVLNFGASAYSVKEMAATLQYRMVDIQPDLVVMAIIPSDFNLARTPTIDGSGYLIDQKLSYVSPPGSMARQVLRGIHLTYVLRDIGLTWFFKPLDIAQVLSRGEIPESYRYIQQFKATADQHGLSYVIALLPRMQRNSWGPLPDKLARDRITHIDLSFLGNEFTEEQYRASRFDPHPSAAVHHRIGEALADYVQHQSRFAQ